MKNGKEKKNERWDLKDLREHESKKKRNPFPSLDQPESLTMSLVVILAWA